MKKLMTTMLSGLSLGLSLGVSVSAFAATGGGNGGAALVCFNSKKVVERIKTEYEGRIPNEVIEKNITSIELLDMIDTRSNYRYQNHEMMDTDDSESWMDFLVNFSNRFEERLPGFSASLKKQISRMNDGSISFRPTGIDFINDIGDTGYGDPTKCIFATVAKNTREKPYQPLNVYVDNRLFDKLSDIEQKMLMLHELIYSLAPERAREFNSYLESNEGKKLKAKNVRNIISESIYKDISFERLRSILVRNNYPGATKFLDDSQLKEISVYKDFMKKLNSSPEMTAIEKLYTDSKKCHLGNDNFHGAYIKVNAEGILSADIKLYTAGTYYSYNTNGSYPGTTRRESSFSVLTRPVVSEFTTYSKMNPATCSILSSGTVEKMERRNARIDEREKTREQLWACKGKKRCRFNGKKVKRSVIVDRIESLESEIRSQRGVHTTDIREWIEVKINDALARVYDEVVAEAQESSLNEGAIARIMKNLRAFVVDFTDSEKNSRATMRGVVQEATLETSIPQNSEGTI